MVEVWLETAVGGGRVGVRRVGVRRVGVRRVVRGLCVSDSDCERRSPGTMVRLGIVVLRTQ